VPECPFNCLMIIVIVMMTVVVNAARNHLGYLKLHDLNFNDFIFMSEYTERWGTGVVICLQQGANDLDMVQLMSLPPHHVLLHPVKSRIPFWCRLTQVVPEKMQLNGCMCNSVVYTWKHRVAAESIGNFKFRYLSALNNTALGSLRRLYSNWPNSTGIFYTSTWWVMACRKLHALIPRHILNVIES